MVVAVHLGVWWWCVLIVTVVDHACSLVYIKKVISRVKKKKSFKKRTYLRLETCLCLKPPLLLLLLLLVAPAVGGRGRREREREDGTCHSDEGSLKSTSIM